MQSRLSHASLGAAVMLALVLRWSTVDAQPAPTAPTPTSASDRAKAKKLTDDAIAAESAKNYAAAIALYKQAYQLVPHPILQFNIGQVYMMAGNLMEAEKYFKHYLARDPDGPGASVARRFLASLPATASSPPQTGSPPQPDSPTSSGKQTITTTSDVAASRKHEPPASNGDRVIVGGLGDQRRDQIALTPRATAFSEDELRRAPSEMGDEEKRKQAIEHMLYIGYALVGVGLPTGIAALALTDNEYRLGLAFTAVVCSVSGAAVLLHADSQRRAAKAVAWSPVIGAGFAGVALGGSLP